MSHLTEEFIQKQKARLLKDRSKIAEEIKALKKDDPFSDPEYANDNAAIDSDVRDQDWHQNIEAQINELARRESDIEIALKKIEKGTYGVCEKTNRPISEARLELVPEARFLVDQK